MIYTLTPLSGCMVNITPLVITCITTLCCMLVMISFSKEAVLGALIGGIILSGYYYNQTETIPSENRPVIGTLIKTETVVTDDFRKHIYATYEVEGYQISVETKNDLYPKKAVFYANKSNDTCSKEKE